MLCCRLRTSVPHPALLPPPCFPSPQLTPALAAPPPPATELNMGIAAHLAQPHFQASSQ